MNELVRLCEKCNCSVSAGTCDCECHEKTIISDTSGRINDVVFKINGILSWGTPSEEKLKDGDHVLWTSFKDLTLEELKTLIDVPYKECAFFHFADKTSKERMSKYIAKLSERGLKADSFQRNNGIIVVIGN